VTSSKRENKKTWKSDERNMGEIKSACCAHMNCWYFMFLFGWYIICVGLGRMKQISIKFPFLQLFASNENK
jgi:hypothetical protein